ncbi:hypothetical protein INT47_011389, partial [Mucor saturninus]
MIKLLLAVLFFYGVIATTVDLSDTFCNEAVDINRFSQLLSNHLLFDHLDKAYAQLSKRISFQFRDAIQVKVKKVKSSSTTTIIATNTTKKTSVMQPPVDVQILKRQLKGAVGSFVEDKLPGILTSRYNTSHLSRQLDHLLYQYCPSLGKGGMVSQQCLLDHRDEILSDMDRYTSTGLERTLDRVNALDLPRLFEKTRAQISGILVHFNQNMMDKSHYRLELKIKKRHKEKAEEGDWITPTMVQEFIDTLNHTDGEQDHSMQQFLALST